MARKRGFPTTGGPTFKKKKKKKKKKKNSIFTRLVVDV